MDKINTPKVVQDCHQTLLWLIPTLDHFPKQRRFTLGERLEHGLLDVLTDLISASYSRYKLNDCSRSQSN